MTNIKIIVFFGNRCGTCVAQRLSNGLPRNDPGFDPRRGRCKNLASRPSRGTVNGGAASK